MTDLVTSPAGGPPIGMRRRIAADADAGAVKHAAGILYVAPDGDVLMLRRSSGEQNFAGHWALPGGGVDDGETPPQGAARESREEMGVDVNPEALRPLDMRITPTGTAFHTYAHRVPSKFVPKLNDEHTGYAWAPLNMLPGPMHPAVAQTLQEQLGVGADMAPEDWDGLRDGFLKWTAEEAAEGEHAEDEEADIADDANRPATDSALRLALDRDSVREFDKAGRLGIAKANISKATVNPYRGSEIPNSEALGLEPDRIYYLLRDPDELAKAAASFNRVQLLQKHIPVSAADAQQWDVVGCTGSDSSFEDPFLTNSLSVWTADAIALIESDAKRELSCGYNYRADMTPGNFHGTRYDGVMRDIVGNHVALVKDGRAGPEVVIGDSMENVMSKPTRLAAVALRLTARTLLPLMAMDAALPPLMPLFKDVTSKNFKAEKTKILAAITSGTKDRLAKDASLEGVVELLDALEGTARDPASDESVSEEQHKAMEAAASGESTLGIPKKVGAEFVAKDAEPLRNFLKGKGMDEADIQTAMDMMPKTAMDESPEEKAAREKKDADDKAAKDAEMKNMVTKPAMDAAITTAVTSATKVARDTERGIRVALNVVRPYVGELNETMAFDTADDVYRKAAVILEIPDAATIHASALPALIKMKPAAGVRANGHRAPAMALDSAQSTELGKLIPGLERIVGA